MAKFILITNEERKEYINVDHIQRVREYSCSGNAKSGIQLVNMFVTCEETVDEIIRKIEETKNG